jgi:simple sugar transport system permease protein
MINGGPLQDPNISAAPVSKTIGPGAKLPIVWDQDLNGGIHLPQGLHMGVFIALGALVLYWAVLNRTTLGYAVRAVGFNPEAARYGGISVSRNYFLAMAISGAFAGLAGSMDLLGWTFNLTNDSVSSTGTSQIAFLGIAVALLGRNTAVGVGLAAFLFGALLYGTTHGLQSGTIDPSLAGHLTEMIQGLVVLFVGADVLILAVWNSRRKLKRRRREPATAAPEGAT